MMLHHAYNDYYHRGESHPPVAPEDWEQFVDNAKWIIDHTLKDDAVKAEFYREIGAFDQALSMLDAYQPSNAFMEEYAKNVRERAEKKDNRVFRTQ